MGAEVRSAASSAALAGAQGSRQEEQQRREQDQRNPDQDHPPASCQAERRQRFLAGRTSGTDVRCCTGDELRTGVLVMPKKLT